jgi:hypothetical protein
MLTRKTMWTAAAAIAVCAMGCDNATSSTTPAPAPAPSPVSNTNAVVPTPAVTDPIANVANRARIKDDPNATKIDPPKAATLVTGFSTITRESPRGAAMETVETIANVSEVERDGDYYLITYPDPKGSTKTYAAWVYKDALESGQWATTSATQATGNAVQLTNANPTAANKLACASGLSHVRTTRDFCAMTCKDDTGCDSKIGQICDGLAFKVNESNNKTENTRFCISDTSRNANDAHGSEHGTLPK